MLLLLPLLAFFLCFARTSTYRPVILMHGILSEAKSMQPVADHIERFYPETSILNIDLYEDTGSVFALSKQVEAAKEKVKPFMEQASDGVNMICNAQGALICRALLELMEDHNVHTFISLSGPQAGQYGDTDYLKFLFPKYTKETFYEIFYTVNGQMLSVANYWKDPNHFDLFEKYCTFLTSLNNASPAHKRNFLRIQQAVFIGGPDDGVVTPWQSSHFGFYGENGSVVEFQHQPVFTEDTFGLRTLYEAGNVTICTCPGVQHVEWPRSLEVFEKCIKPWLAE